MKRLKKLLEFLLLVFVVSGVGLQANKTETKRRIIEICNEIGASVPVVMSIASIESNFNTGSIDRSGSCVGIFQLKDGYGGCKGDDRLDLEKSIKALHQNHQKLKSRWLKSVGFWDDFYYYGIHQKGFSGFLEIYNNRYKLLTDISAIRCKTILSSKPRSAEWQSVNDWWLYYENRFYKVYNQYSGFPIWIYPPKKKETFREFLQRRKY